MREIGIPHSKPREHYSKINRQQGRCCEAKAKAKKDRKKVKFTHENIFGMKIIAQHWMP